MKKIILIFVVLSMVLMCGCDEIITNVVEQLPSPEQTEGTQQDSISTSDPGTITIASFNIQILGQSKMDQPLAIEYLPKIIKKYDIVAIQELRDSSGTAIEELHALLPGYDMVVSERLGRTTSKEQYVIFYKNSDILDYYVYNDVGDVFEREPLIAYFTYSGEQFSLIVNHIKPDDAEKEIEALEQVVLDVQSQNGDSDFILLGDLNADCTYYDEDLDFLREYRWVISDNKDTTVGSNDCTYDRIITNMEYGSSGVFNYEEEYDLSNENAKIISDHYPVWITI